MSAAAGTLATPNSYMILGHGHEEFIPFADRDTMPAGKTLVTLVDFGTPTTILDACPFLEAFADPANAELFKDPIHNFKTLSGMLGRPIRIYQEGMKYPKLLGSLSFHFFFDEKIQTNMYYSVSGVHSFPLQLNTLNPAGTQPCQKYFGKVDLGIPSRPFAFRSAEDIDSFLTAYEHSLMPTKSEVKAIFDAKPTVHVKGGEPDTLEKQLMTPLERIWERLGDGVYYFVICRAVKATPTTRSFEDIVGAILGLADIDEGKYKHFLDYKQKWHPHLGSLYALLEADRKKYFSTYGKNYVSDEMETLLKQINLLGKEGRLIRENSNRQQIEKAWGTRRRGGRRHRRRRTQKKRKV